MKKGLKPGISISEVDTVHLDGWSDFVKKGLKLFIRIRDDIGYREVGWSDFVKKGLKRQAAPGVRG